MGIFDNFVNSAQMLAETSAIIDENNRTLAAKQKQRDNAILQTAQASEKQTLLLKQQLEFLQKQNEEQAKELKSNKIFQWISWGITTFIAIASIVVAIVK